MSQTVPTTQALADDIVADIDAELDHNTPFLAKAFTRVLSKVLAGANVLLWKYASWMTLQMFVQTASMKETVILGVAVRPLVFWGRLFGAGDPLAATRAELVVTVTVLVQSGSIDAGRQFVYAPTGVVYTATAAVLLNAATVPVTVRAASDQQGGAGEGTVGNLVPGTMLQMANPLPNVARACVVASQSVTGADAESEDAYRARVLRRVQSKPQGGASADYQLWGEEDAGIVHVYPYAGAPGEVDVYVEATPDSSGSPDGIPTGAQLTAVLALINADISGLASRRPTNAAVNALPITRQAFNVLVTGLEVEDVSGTHTAITDALDEYLRAREPFIVGLSQLPRVDRITQAAISGLIDNVVSALGGSVATVALRQGVDPLNAYTLGHGEKAKLGTVTYI
jgi:uncharacterized phage protein gp47/JayE